MFIININTLIHFTHIIHRLTYYIKQTIRSPKKTKGKKTGLNKPITIIYKKQNNKHFHSIDFIHFVDN